jgi:hypothetical protein
VDNRRVLLIGKRTSVLTRLAAALAEHGIEAETAPPPTGAAGAGAAAGNEAPAPQNGGGYGVGAQNGGAAAQNDGGYGSGDGVVGYGVVAFGRSVRAADRARLRAQFSAADPEVVFVDGYAPIIPLLVAQFEQALDRRPLGRRTIVDAAVRGGIVDVELRAPCRLRITAYRLGALHRTRERVVFDRDVEAGLHSAALGSRAARSRTSFVVIRAGDETAALPAGDGGSAA